MGALGPDGGTYYQSQPTPTAPPKTVTVGKTGGLQSRRTVNPNSPGSYINQPPSSKLNSIIKKSKSPLTTGIISQSVEYKGGAQKHPFSCRFMFNPATITVSYGTDESAIDPSNLTAEQLKGQAVLPGMTTISFGLLFDRTYEVAYGPEKGQRDLRDVGCYEDIWALESVTRARLNFASVVKEADGKEVAHGPTIGNMYPTACYVIFGGGDGSDGSKVAPGLGYIGYITSMTVNYALFSSRMVPIRCGVEISMTQLIGQDFSKYQRNSSLNTTSRR